MGRGRKARTNMFSFGLSSSDEDIGRQPSAKATCGSLKGARQPPERACCQVGVERVRHSLPFLTASLLLKQAVLATSVLAASMDFGSH